MSRSRWAGPCCPGLIRWGPESLDSSIGHNCETLALILSAGTREEILRANAHAEAKE